MILLVNSPAGGGKDTFFKLTSEILSNVKGSPKCYRYAFADSIKVIAKNLFGWDGNKDREGRQLLIFIGQYLGSEYEYMTELKKEIVHNYKYNGIEVYAMLELFFTKDKNFWSDIVINKMLLDGYNKDNLYIITDFRFQKEYFNMKLYFNEMNIKTVYIDRKNVELIDDKSEKDLKSFNFDFYIDNNSDLEHYRKNINEYLRINHYFI